jgi:dipeptidyl aminopeptidase/acylaminoacyl peptidase
LTTELHHWKSPDGKLLQGILYKPENFDSTKKYPLIFHYYDQQSDGLNIYVEPGPSDVLNIPYFVSNGYVVFVPDIHYTIGEPGESALRSVTSAARYLSKYSWVDTTKMGLQGHSFGGYETNYLITHTNLFAAAAEANGATDLVSSYGDLQAGASARWLFEIFQFRLRATLWGRPDLYIKNSPIFKVPSVTTPLLMMHPKNDPIVPWSQAVELFNAMHRLGKTVWMLQYDEGDHGLNGKSAMDYTIRLTQFFDHYLKDAPAPLWITQGIPAKLKQVESRYELDPSGNCAKDCKVCKMWNEKMKKDSAGTMKEIQEKIKTEHWMGGGDN